MNDHLSSGSEQFSLRQRVALAACGAVLFLLLVVAACLQPDPAGLGTHQQLGLPPCTFRWMFDMRCPSCGMTTSWSRFVRGQFAAALSANVGGVLLAVAACLAAPWALASAVRGAWLVRPPSDRVLAGVAVGIAVITLIDWSVRIAQG